MRAFHAERGTRTSQPSLRQAQDSAQEGNHSNAANAETIVMAARRSADLTLSGFTPLPGAKAELEKIHALLKEKPTPDPSLDKEGKEKSKN